MSFRIEGNVRPASQEEQDSVHWWPANRTARLKDNPLLDRVLHTIDESGVAVVSSESDYSGAVYVFAKRLRDSAKKRGVSLNTSIDSKNKKLFIRRDPQLHPKSYEG